jgi:hypothetical protein
MGSMPRENVYEQRMRRIVFERFFHLDDPDGHELSFARPLRPST